MNAKPFFLLLLLLCFIPLAYGGSVSGTDFIVFIECGGSLGFQNQPSHFVLLSVNSGELNSSDTYLSMSNDHGRFTFYSNNSATLIISYSVSRIQVSGDMAQDARLLANNTQISIAPTNTVTLEWWITVEPWLPIMFIFGMIGLVAMFAGPMIGIKKWKEHDYYNGARMAIMLFAIGFGLTISWLWSIA
jgi:hypothetical protein